MCRIICSLVGRFLKMPRNGRYVSQEALRDCPAVLAKMNRRSECVMNKFLKFAQRQKASSATQVDEM